MFTSNPIQGDSPSPTISFSSIYGTLKVLVEKDGKEKKSNSLCN
jgi:hypothetical protein